MNTISSFFDWIQKFNSGQPFIDIWVFTLVIAGGFFAKRYLSWLKVPTVFSTLIAGTFFVLGYLVAMKISGILLKTDAVKYFVSYALATSFYELLLSWLIEWIGKLTQRVKDSK
jgi:hypothetical protein